MAPVAASRGPSPNAGRVVVIEDVITTGESALNAVAALRETTATVLGVFAIVDRQEGGAERIRDAALPLTTLYTTAELLAD